MTPHLSPGDTAAIEAAVRNHEGDTRPLVDIYDRDEPDDDEPPSFWIVAIPLALLVAGAVVAGVMMK